MPTRKNINKSKGATDFGPTVEDDEWDAKSMTSLSENAGSSSQLATTPADMAPDLDVIQRLEMRSDFATKFLNAIHDVKRDVWDFSGRMDEAEERISKVEDAVYTEKGKTEELIKQVDLLKHKLDDLENRSRRSNLRLVNWSRKVWRNRFSRETATWSSATFPSPPVIERAHRIPTGAQNTRFPWLRVLIIKFLNFQDKVQAMRAARTKGKILYGEQEVMFFPDISAELQRQRRRCDGVKQQLRSLDIRYGMVYPAKLRMTADGRTHEFNSPADAEKFSEGLKQSGGAQETWAGHLETNTKCGALWVMTWGNVGTVILIYIQIMRGGCNIIIILLYLFS